MASVQNRLRHFAQTSKTDFSRILNRYANERFLFRLSQTDAARKFVLKGAVLFTVWTGAPHRNTGDLDLLGFGDNSPEALEYVFREIMQTEVPDDGLVFLPASMKIETRRDEEQYPGLKIKFTAMLGNAIIPLQIDIGFGDVVSPDVIVDEVPPLLDHLPAPRLAMYPRQTVVAEKFEAIVSLDETNSRYKDFFDIWFLATRFDFEADSLRDAVIATFKRRKTALPTETPSTLKPEWARTTEAAQYWQGFIRRSGLGNKAPDFSTVSLLVWNFLSPVVHTALEKPKVPAPGDADAVEESLKGNMSRDQGQEASYWPSVGPWQAPT